MPARLVTVAVPVPALDLLTYSVPDSLAMPVAGARVVVPLGRRTLTGIVVPFTTPPPADVSLRDVVAVLDTEAFLPEDVLHLTAWVADYYLAGPGAALAVALPPNALAGRTDAFRTVRYVALTARGLDVHAEHAPPLTALQRHAVTRLRAAPDGMRASELAADGISAAVIARLKARGLLTSFRTRIERDPFAASQRGQLATDVCARMLSVEQRVAVDRLTSLAAERAFKVALLHGVTGSGKTEVYLHLADAVRRSGRGVLMLVPEIALTPAVAAAFRGRFGESVAIQHSGLSDGERHDQWHRIRRGEVDVVIGTRSAVFVPLRDPGLIIVDEEHDGSYKQEETPRYHGRDVAVMRGKFAAALVVLGSATPSMESYANGERQRYEVISLSRRVLDRPLASVRVVNMREEFAAVGPEVILSRALQEALTLRLAQREQALVLLNRRGYAAAIFCRQCTSTMECPNCSVSLTVHSGRSSTRGHAGVPWSGRCHYCNYSRAIPATCAACGAPYLQQIGFGTERVEAEIIRLFPEARVGRIDRDTVRRRGRLTSLLDRFASQQLDVLVGTQMIAKGHDFPQVTLVGVISADVGLGLADFRAAERTFQLLTQVAGRAGRGERPGEVVIQTLFPTHYSIRLAMRQDYGAFYDNEIAFRRAMRYPPVLAMVNVVVRGKTHDAAMAAAAAVARRTETRGGGAFVVLGPAPAPLTRLRGEHRAQFFLKGASRRAMRTALRAALAESTDLARKIAVDIDPLSVL